MGHNLAVDDDIESCRIMTVHEEQEESSSSAPISGIGLVHFDVSVQGRNPDDFAGNVQVVIDALDNKAGPVVEDKKHSERRKSSSSAKKPPKPPRPPRGVSLDAADQKLIRELHELAMLRRARIERMKALKKMKAAVKAPSASSNGGNLFAMLCTVLFCIVIICQGMSSGSNTAVSFNNSLAPAEAMENSYLVLENQITISSASPSNSSDSLPPDSLEDITVTLGSESFGERGNT